MTSNLRAKLQFQREIGRGHYGVVYEALDQIHGQVAVKVFVKRDDESDFEWQQRKLELLNEGQRLKEAEHENIVRVYQILEAEDKDAVYLVMEYCANGCLNDLYQQGPMGLRELRDVLTDAAFGIQAVHFRGMLHRDIKPSNIMIGNNLQAKVGDFGLVTNRLIYGYAKGFGYVDHLAPEIYHTGLASTKTDVWAFGMTAYRLLHGKTFFEELPAPRELVPSGGFAQKLPWLPHVPDSWRRFVRKALHDNTDLRFQDAGDLLNGLKKLPVLPDWRVQYSPNSVIWERNTSKSRILRVQWIRHSVNKHEWEAHSIPVASGRELKLAGSTGLQTRREVESSLHEYLIRKTSR
ncbi:MAG: serine/threonine protein kinase [Chloroflexi bacterium]|nr:serine/threonine protein kinase [Chloroflexota bacterium]